MSYRRQHKAATQGMQNLGDGASPEGEGQERSAWDRAARSYAGRNGRPQRKECRSLPSNTLANCTNAGKVTAGSDAHTMPADSPNVWRGAARSMAKARVKWRQNKARCATDALGCAPQSGQSRWRKQSPTPHGKPHETDPW